MTKELTTKSPYTEQQIDLIKNTIAKGATDDELKLFLYVANKSGLDPLSKQIYFVKRGGKMTVQTGIDGFRAIAERSKTLAGIDDAVYDSEEKYLPKKASVTVYRFVNKERVSFTASARWSEYFPGEALGFMWKKMPYLMLGKCAEALALRKAFPNNLSGIYVEEEMEQGGISDNHKEDVFKEQDESFNAKLRTLGITKEKWEEATKLEWDKLDERKRDAGLRGLDNKIKSEEEKAKVEEKEEVKTFDPDKVLKEIEERKTRGVKKLTENEIKFVEELDKSLEVKI